MQESIAMKRILMIEKKQRKRTYTMLDEGLLDIIKEHKLDLNNIINLGIEKLLREERGIKKKKRKHTQIWLEIELHKKLKEENLDFNATINLGIEEILKMKKLL
jgi:post-segregation antitoxin (ccd killing protein)